MVRAFDLESLEKSYDELIDKWKGGEVHSLSSALRWELGYFDVVSSDPCLPEPPLPTNWSGGLANDIYLEHIRELILKGSS